MLCHSNSGFYVFLDDKVCQIIKEQTKQRNLPSGQSAVSPPHLHSRKCSQFVPILHHRIEQNSLWSETYSTVKLQRKQSLRFLCAPFNEWMNQLATISSIPILSILATSSNQRLLSSPKFICLRSLLRKVAPIKRVWLFKVIWCQTTDLKWSFPISLLARMSVCGREPAGCVGRGSLPFYQIIWGSLLL